MPRFGIKSILLKIALAGLNFAAAASLNILMWRNNLWREDRWTKKRL